MNWVESATGGVWEYPSADEERAAAAIARHHGLPELMGRALAVRGIPVDEVPGFLNPRLNRLMPDPAILADMPAASLRLAEAVRRGESVAVYGDYDVDGACSVTLLVGWLRDLGVDAEWRIPHRVRDGYGPKPAILSELGARNGLVIVADSGSSLEAAEGIAAARNAGAEVIVADHHACEGHGPRDSLLINPTRPDDESGLDCLCATGVVFMLLVATARELRESGWFASDGTPEPRLEGWLDLVALATVADAVPLQGINRAFVRFGLREMRKQRRAGIRALLERTRVAGEVTEHHLGWSLGPQLNAPGRIGPDAEDPNLPVQLLLADGGLEARELAEACETFNARRRRAQERVLEDVEASVCVRGTAPNFAWFAERRSGEGNSGWHPGVVGIAAGRLADRLRRPVIVLASNGELYKGSGRSYRDMDLGTAVRRVRMEGLLIRGGGHRGAVGIEADAARLEEAMTRVGEVLDELLPADSDSRPHTRIVGAVAPRGFTPALHDLLDRAGPFGRGAPRPRIVLGGVRVRYQPRLLSDAHYLVQLADEAGTGIKAMAFGAAGTPLGKALGRVRRGDLIDAMGEIAIDDYQGTRQAFMRLEDIASR